MANSEIFLISQPSPTATGEVLQFDETARANGYQFDAVTRYTTTYRFKTTDHVIPSGGVVSDHVVTAPLAYTLTGVLTPYHVVTPLRVIGALAGTNQLAFRQELANSTATANEAIVRKKDQLVQFATSHTALTIVGNDFTYNNMVIVSLSMPKSVSDGRSIPVTAQFKQVRVAPEASEVNPLVDEDAQKLGIAEQEVEDNYFSSIESTPIPLERRAFP